MRTPRSDGDLAEVSESMHAFLTISETLTISSVRSCWEKRSKVAWFSCDAARSGRRSGMSMHRSKNTPDCWDCKIQFCTSRRTPLRLMSRT